MNAVSALSIVVGLILGTAASTFAGPLFLPYSNQAINEIESTKGLSIRLRGTIVGLDSEYLYLNKEAEQGQPRTQIKVAYDARSLMLVRKKEMDDEGRTAQVALLTGPSDAVLRIGSDIYLTVWVTKDSAPPYALAVFVTI